MTQQRQLWAVWTERELKRETGAEPEKLSRGARKWKAPVWKPHNSPLFRKYHSFESSTANSRHGWVCSQSLTLCSVLHISADRETFMFEALVDKRTTDESDGGQFAFNACYTQTRAIFVFLWADSIGHVTFLWGCFYTCMWDRETEEREREKERERERERTCVGGKCSHTHVILGEGKVWRTWPQPVTM